MAELVPKSQKPLGLKNYVKKILKFLRPAFATLCLLHPIASAQAGEPNCALEEDDSLFSAGNVRFLRSGSVVAKGYERKNRLGFIRYGGRTPKSWKRSVQIRYQIQDDTSGVENFVFYNVVGKETSGTIVVNSVSNKSVLTVRYLDEIESAKTLNLEYSKPLKLEFIFEDIACLAKILPIFR